MLDGRSMYLDFFGFVMWDLLPIQANEIERIEVVRGPGSAVWGANAMTGVVNVISRRPKDMVGTTRDRRHAVREHGPRRRPSENSATRSRPAISSNPRTTARPA